MTYYNVTLIVKQDRRYSDPKVRNYQKFGQNIRQNIRQKIRQKILQKILQKTCHFARMPTVADGRGVGFKN